jgi:hypothetical protein
VPKRIHLLALKLNRLAQQPVHAEAVRVTVSSAAVFDFGQQAGSRPTPLRAPSLRRPFEKKLAQGRKTMKIAPQSCDPEEAMKTLLGILAVLVVAASLFADYKWRQWMAARRRDRQ